LYNIVPVLLSDDLLTTIFTIISTIVFLNDDRVIIRENVILIAIFVTVSFLTILFIIVTVGVLDALEFLKDFLVFR